MDTAAAVSRVMRRAEELAAFSEEPAALTRRYATPALRAANDAVGGWMRATGMHVREDAIGNVIGRYEAAQAGARTLLLGSHLDTVRDAGRFDGALGVLVALAIVESLRAADRRLPLALEVCAFADEEGVRFATSYLGSGALTGSVTDVEFERIDDAGVRLSDAIRAFGGDPDALAAARREPAELAGYLEVHIEQGPVLERRGLAVGVVSAIAGQTRYQIAYEGTAGHAGTVPMAMRRDAVAGAAELVLAAEAIARETDGLVATVGELLIHPGSSNVIPRRAELSLDVRHADDAVRADACARLRARADAVAAARGLTLSRWETVLDHDATRCSPELTLLLERAIADVGLAPVRLVSGAGHDGVAVAAIAPIGMLFVRCRGGVSHSPDEAVEESDVAVAIAILQRAVEQLAASEPARPSEQLATTEPVASR